MFTRVCVMSFGAAAGCAGQCPSQWLPGGLEHPAFADGGQVSSISRVGGDIVVAGTFVFTDSAGVLSRNAARWDGAAWHAMPGMLDQQGSGYRQVACVLGYQGQAFIAGNFRLDEGWRGAARWDGSGWRSFVSPVQGWCNSLALYDGRIVLAGASVFLPGMIVSAAAFDGSAWQPMWTVPGQAMSLAVNNGELYIGASQGYTGPGYVYRWNGWEWDAIPLTPGPIMAMASHQGALVAALDTAGAGGSLGVVRWDGIAWGWISSSSGQPPGAHVLCLASDGQTLYAGGYGNETNGYAFAFVNALQGGVWAPMEGLGRGSSSYGAFVYGLYADATGLWAGGDFEMASGRPSPGVARWSTAAPVCYANCDCSTTAPALNVLDFSCFLNRFAAADAYANCDGSTAEPVLNVNDFICFLNRFAAGCP